MTATRPVPRPHRSFRARGTVLRLVVGVLAGVLLLTGCDLRLETPAPEEPAPDAIEIVRRRAVEDAVALAAAAQAAAADPDVAADATLTRTLGQVMTFSARHADQLGGTYDSGLEPTATPTQATTAVTASPSDVLTLLSVTALTARGDADTVETGEMARLLASVATSRATLAGVLAGALGVEDPTEPATATAAPEIGAVDPSALAALVVAEDEAGYAFEVIAAKLADAQRAAALDAAAGHRASAQGWAVAVGLDGTSADPRRAAYALPSGLDDPAVAVGLARTVQTGLATSYASLVAAGAAGTRAAAVRGLQAAADESLVWGAEPVAFPGLPEQADGAADAA
ncbi:DUF4439 domain-containing protein [Cellulomonas sp. P22]|uniref:DUF4439 domain-containing protein n=1 Tax=Cellulomonas sp. P22 TaxID=3373189 RepID=UPI0037B73E7D